MNKTVINAYSMKDAVVLAKDQLLCVTKDKTQTWKKAECPVNEDFNEFAKAELEKANLTDKPNTGIIICTDPGKPNLRLRPYKVVNYPQKGPAKKELVYQISRKDNLGPLALCKSKMEALNVAKEIVKTHGIDVICERVYRLDENHRVSFEINYTPTPGTNLGEYVVVTA